MVQNVKEKKKPPVELLPAKPLFRVSEVLDFGGQKYGYKSYLTTTTRTGLSAAALRHILKWMNGEELDEESDLHHLAHAAADLLLALDLIEHERD